MTDEENSYQVNRYDYNFTKIDQIIAQSGNQEDAKFVQVARVKCSVFDVSLPLMLDVSRIDTPFISILPQDSVENFEYYDYNDENLSDSIKDVLLKHNCTDSQKCRINKYNP